MEDRTKIGLGIILCIAVALAILPATAASESATIAADGTNIGPTQACGTVLEDTQGPFDLPKPPNIQCESPNGGGAGYPIRY